MEIKKSDLILQDFNVLNFSFKTDNSFKGIPEFQNYIVDMDFKILTDKVKIGEFINILAMNINTQKLKLPGYSFSILTIGKFYINNFKSHPDKEKNNFIFRSSLPMMIANCRAFLSNVSAFGKFGKYSLPSIDITHFLNNYKPEDSKIKIVEKSKPVKLKKNKSRK
ncbi:MAG TPA: hypothetical protein PLG90_04775 [Ignavibacteria bacterium]|nr:hypothetical protein [Ignavibacteria bacterium]